MKSYKEFITEIFDQPVKLKYGTKYKTKSGVDWEATFKVDKQDYRVMSYPKKDGQIVDFSWTTPMGMYGFGKTSLGAKSAGIVLATVMQFIQDLIDEAEPKVIKFTAEKSDDDNPESRIKLYTSMVKKFTPKEYTSNISNAGNKVEFTLTRK
jgi:hypothetical protein